jgi:hypothetical protein
MLKLNWKDQYSNWDREIAVDTMTAAVKEFKILLTGLYAHGGGYVQLLDTDHEDMPVIQWTEGVSMGYVSGRAVLDYHPAEDLDDCDNTECATHSAEGQDLCEACETRCREICLEKLGVRYAR